MRSSFVVFFGLISATLATTGHTETAKAQEALNQCIESWVNKVALAEPSVLDGAELIVGFCAKESFSLGIEIANTPNWSNAHQSKEDALEAAINEAAAISRQSARKSILREKTE